MMTVTGDERMRSPLKAWVRALERTSSIGRDPTLTLPVLIDRLAAGLGDAPALIGQKSRLSYSALAEAGHRLARWGLAQGLARGDVICLFMKNCPEYLAIWLGLSRIGVTVALINTNLTGELLRHSIAIVHPRFVIAGASLGSVLAAARATLDAGIVCCSYGDGGQGFRRLDREVESLPAAPLGAADCPLPSLAERALYI